MEKRLLLVVGVLGGFTTFSSFALDTFVLAERGESFLAVTYIVASLGLSLLATFGGLALGRAIL